MRIRTFLILAFLFVSLVPTSIFAAWSYNNNIKNEFDAVEDQHLLIAHNLGAALKRYHTDVVATFDAVANRLAERGTAESFKELMSTVDMKEVFLIDDTGRITARVYRSTTANSAFLSQEQLALAKAQAIEARVTFSDVMASNAGDNIMLVAREYGDTTAVGVLSTRYFADLGASISFGVKGHAAIVDSNGNVLAHPLPSWVAARKNIAKVTAVQKMMAGDTGIDADALSRAGTFARSLRGKGAA